MSGCCPALLLLLLLLFFFRGHVLCSALLTVSWFQCCFPSTETVRTIRGGEPRTSTSTFTQLLSSVVSVFSVALRPQRSYGLLGAQDVHLDFHTAPELCRVCVQCCFTSTETVGTIRDVQDAQDVHLLFHTDPDLCCFVFKDRRRKRDRKGKRGAEKETLCEQ